MARQPIPRLLDALVIQCLAKSPEQRPQTMGEVGARLLTLLDAIESRPPTESRLSAAATRRPFLFLAGLVAAMAGIGVAIGFWPASDTPPWCRRSSPPTSRRVNPTRNRTNGASNPLGGTPRTK